MNQQRLIGLFLCLIPLIWGCQITKKSVAPHPTNSTSLVEKDDQLIKFTFLQINDVYEISPMEGGKSAGMARVATLHKELLDENPNTLFVLAGDFLNPSLYGTIKGDDGKTVSGRQMIETMNVAGVDVVAFGNHEFDVKEAVLQARINESEFQWIGTNVLQTQVDSLYPFSSENKVNYLAPFYKEKNGQKTYLPETFNWKIKDGDGTELTIGLFSATINSNPKPFVKYEDFMDEAVKNYLELTCQSDIVLGLTHLLIEDDMLLASKLPNVPLLMGGHEHHHMEVQVGDVKITKADANAKTAWVHRFEFNKKTKTYTFDSELVKINDSIKNETATQKVVKHWESVLHNKLKEVYPNPEKVIYYATEPLDGRAAYVRTRQTNLGRLIAAGLASAAKQKADLGMVNAGGIRIDDQLEDSIQAIDIFRVLPFTDNTAEISLSGIILLKVLENGLVNKYGQGSYLQLYNATYDKDKKTGTVGGKAIIPSQTYHVGLNSYLAGDLIKKGVIPKPVKKIEVGGDARVAIINYLDSL